MNYESMSDFEINKAVATAWLPCDYDFDDKTETVDLVGCATYLGAHGIPDERLEKYGEFNPCNNPADAWPIIIDNKISIEYDQSEDSWIAHQGDYLIGKYVSICGYRYQYSDKNPLRAAMIVFLMMNENTKSNECDEE